MQGAFFMIFGTDGIRGLVNKEINCELCYKVGKAVALFLKKRKLNSVLIGRDPRLSSETYSMALITGLIDYGINVVNVGVVSTPIVSYLVSMKEYSAGIMVTASHNDYRYNGIKIFNSKGFKLDCNEEFDIERMMNSQIKPSKIKGKYEIKCELVNDYINYLKTIFSSGLKNINVVVDCANGANENIAPLIYKELGANVIVMGCRSDGLNINEKCGANNLKKLIYEVKYHKADFGIAFDGDGDRLAIVNSCGEVISGEEILIRIALDLKSKNQLKDDSVVGTIISSKALEDALKNNNINLIRVDVGDKNVIEKLDKDDLSLGGESSGHICIYDFIKTCDALFVSLYYLLQCANCTFSNVKNIILKYPIISENIDCDKKDILFKNNEFKSSINEVIKENNNALVVVRPSGTEPKIRLYIESISNLKNKKIYENITKIIKKYKQ